MSSRTQTGSWARLLRLMVLPVCAFCLASAAAWATDGDALDQLMARLRQRQHDHVTFTERLITRVLDRPLESSGEVFYDAPDRLEKRILKPRPERLVLENGMLTLERRHREYHVALADFPQAAPYIDSIRATLAGDRRGLERVFHVEFSDAGDEWNLLLSPLEPKVAVQVESIRIQGAADVIRTVAVQLANGDRSIMTLARPTGP